MLIAKLAIGYDRGLKRNHDEDLGEKAIPRLTEDGKVIAGLGTHYPSQDEKVLVKERQMEAARIREAFRDKFMITPIDGCYYMPGPGVAKMYLDSLQPGPGVRAYVTEFDLESSKGLDQRELEEWALKTKRQLQGVQLGRKKDADEKGLQALITLSKCPILSADTGKRIRELVAGVRNEKITKLDLRRKIDLLDVKLEKRIIQPRRAPTLK